MNKNKQAAAECLPKLQPTVLKSRGDLRYELLVLISALCSICIHKYSITYTTGLLTASNLIRHIRT